ncbi:condensation domain-containing protein [Vibrio cidicii]|uniref:condensation domain-containing protein n=1 Tax=Vibrio cidicii TaxID=1763883 RepID=UPI003752735C
MALLFAQRPFWQRHCAQPQSNQDQVAHSLDIFGELQLDLFLQALQMTLSEVDVFRLRFNHRGESDMADNEVMCEVFDLSHLTQAANIANQQIEADLHSEKSLFDSQLTRLQLYRLSRQQHRLYLRSHHILLDGYGMMLIEQRLCQAYAALLDSQTAAEPLNRYYAYLEEEARYQTSERAVQDQCFWRHYLDAKPALPITPVDTDLLFAQELCFSSELDATQRSALLKLSEALRIGWPDLLVALCTLYLSEAEAESPWVWLPFMNRWGSVAANIPGLMVNALPMYVPSGTGQSLAEYLLQTSQALRRLYHHGRYRIEQIQHDQGLDAEQSYFMSPFINVLPFEPPVIKGCTTQCQVLAAGSSEGLNITFRGCLTGQMILHIEADVTTYAEEKLRQHANALPTFLQRWLNQYQQSDGVINTLLA